MLRLTVFEIFAVKWPKFGPKISDLGIPGAPTKGERMSGTDVYHHAKFHADQCHCRLQISVTGHKKNNNQHTLPYYGGIAPSGECSPV